MLDVGRNFRRVTLFGTTAAFSILGVATAAATQLARFNFTVAALMAHLSMHAAGVPTRIRRPAGSLRSDISNRLNHDYRDKTKTDEGANKA